MSIPPDLEAFDNRIEMVESRFWDFHGIDKVLFGRIDCQNAAHISTIPQKSEKK